MYKVSVIVPVYNVEKYIRECLISILNQSIQDIEIIIVNDGSTDSSIKQIKDLIEANDNIKLINKKNGGLSSARNEGLKYARGKFIAFIDSDDYIEETFLYELFEEAQTHNLDICIGGYQHLTENYIKKQIRNPKLINNKVMTGIEFFNKEMALYDYRAMVWFKLYKKDFLQENNISFYDNLIYEDEEFTPKVFSKANKVKIIENYGYIYRLRNGSITKSNVNDNNLESLIIILNNLIKLYKESEDKQFKKSIKILISSILTKFLLLSNKVKVYNKSLINKIPKKDIVIIFIKHNESFKDLIKIIALILDIRLYKTICELYYKKY